MSVREMEITFRNQPEVKIWYEYSGYDPSTNDSGLDWWFDDETIKATDKEEIEISKRIIEREEEWDG